MHPQEPYLRHTGPLTVLSPEKRAESLNQFESLGFIDQEPATVLETQTNAFLAVSHIGKPSASCEVGSQRPDHQVKIVIAKRYSQRFDHQVIMMIANRYSQRFDHPLISCLQKDILNGLFLSNLSSPPHASSPLERVYSIREVATAAGNNHHFV